jgi:hypothetical protein
MPITTYLKGFIHYAIEHQPARRAGYHLCRLRGKAPSRSSKDRPVPDTRASLAKTVNHIAAAFSASTSASICEQASGAERSAQRMKCIIVSFQRINALPISR